MASPVPPMSSPPPSAASPLTPPSTLSPPPPPPPPSSPPPTPPSPPPSPPPVASPPSPPLPPTMASPPPQLASSAPPYVKPKLAVTSASSTFFRAGTPVEVRSDDVGFLGSWYGAKVSSRSRSPRRVEVIYDFLRSESDSDRPLRELVLVRNVRPVPPQPPDAASFREGQRVHAFHNDGWWEGVVVKVCDGEGDANGERRRYTVCFPYSAEQIEFGPEQIREHLEWVKGKWVPPKKNKLFTLPLHRIPQPQETAMVDVHKLDTFLLHDQKDGSRKRKRSARKWLQESVNDEKSGASRSKEGLNVKKPRSEGMEKVKLSSAHNLIPASEIAQVENSVSMTPLKSSRVRIIQSGRKESTGLSKFPESEIIAIVRKVQSATAQVANSVSTGLAKSPKSEVMASAKKERSANAQLENNASVTPTESYASEVITSTGKEKHVSFELATSLESQVISSARKKRSAIAKLENCISGTSANSPSSGVLTSARKENNVGPPRSTSEAINTARKEQGAIAEVENNVSMEVIESPPSRVATSARKENSSIAKYPRSNVVTSAGKEQKSSSHTQCAKNLSGGCTGGSYKKRSSAGVLQGDGTMMRKRGRPRKMQSIDAIIDVPNPKGSETPQIQSQSELASHASPDHHPRTDVPMGGGSVEMSSDDASNPQLNATSIYNGVGSDTVQKDAKDLLANPESSAGQFRERKEKGVNGSSSEGPDMSGLDSPEAMPKDCSQENVTKCITATEDQVPGANHTALPFVKRSALWESIKSEVIFSKIPQTPHFRPLEDCVEDQREGVAIGIMVNFVNLVASITKMKISDPLDVIKTKMEMLSEYKTFGFNITPLLNCLKKLRSIKTNEEAQIDQSLLKDHMDKQGEISRLEDNISAITSDINAKTSEQKELERSIATLHARLEETTTLRDIAKNDMAEIEAKLSHVQKVTLLAETEYDSALAAFR